MTDHTQRRADLERRLADLDRRLHQIDSELDSHQSKDWDELAVEREDDEVLEQLGQSGQAEIEQIKAALARMEAGEYGVCVRCGAEISEARLDLLPATPFCKTCAR
jgi:RNA polymerase-binding transcription factor DksA